MKSIWQPPGYWHRLFKRLFKEAFTKYSYGQKHILRRRVKQARREAAVEAVKTETEEVAKLKYTVIERGSDYRTVNAKAGDFAATIRENFTVNGAAVVQVTGYTISYKAAEGTHHWRATSYASAQRRVQKLYQQYRSQKQFDKENVQ